MPSPPSQTGGPRSRTFGTELLTVPVRVARAWTTALAPNKRGGWNFIAQTYELHSGLPPEFVVLDLESGKYTVSEGPVDVYANSNYQIAEQLRAPNGRIFFPEVDNRIAYYDPTDETVKQAGKVVGTPADTAIYRLVFGPNGKLYGGTQSTGLPTVFELDPDKLEITILGNVGQNRSSYSYAYYLAADPPWLYVAVGQTPWELAALNVDTGEQRILATRSDNGFMQFDTRPEGITATLISGLRTPQQTREVVWCVDGKTYPFDPTPGSRLPFRSRNVKPVANPIRQPPELDVTAASPDGDGVGRVAIKRGNAWREQPFKVKYTSPVDIESLVPLADGTLLGNAKQYHGFFRYNPRDRSTQRYGSIGLSGGPRVAVDGKIYVSGYPNGVLYVYDPAKPWTGVGRGQREGNPLLLGNFTGSGAHYPYFLVPSRNGRLYYAGRRERDGIGSGVGSYEISTRKFRGHHDNLSFLDPQGMVVIDDLKRVVFSGRLHDDPSQSQMPGEAQLVVYDYDLKELERQTVKPGISNTGVLFTTPSNSHVVIGLSNTDNVVYRYDVVTKQLLGWKQLDGFVGASTQRASDGSLWVILGTTVVKIDPTTLEVRAIGPIPGTADGGDLLAWQGERLFWASHSELREIAVPREE